MAGQTPLHHAVAEGHGMFLFSFMFEFENIEASETILYLWITKLMNMSTGIGDTAVALLKAGAETDKKDADGFLALELAPDSQVRSHILSNLMFFKTKNA